MGNKYDNNTIFVKEDGRIDDMSSLYDTIDAIFRVGKYAYKSNNILNRNVVVLFEFDTDNIRGMSSGYMSREQKDRESYASFVKYLCKKHIKDDPLVMNRVRHGYFEYLDETSEYFSDRKVDDIVKCGKALEEVEVFTPLCMVAHIDSASSVPHCHILYITHNVRTSLYMVLNEFVNVEPNDDDDDDFNEEDFL